jgi:DNA-binding transcriptional LysR family regulator
VVPPFVACGRPSYRIATGGSRSLTRAESAQGTYLDSLPRVQYLVGHALSQARLALVHADRAIQEARASNGQQTATLNLGYSPLIDCRVISKVRRYVLDAHPAADVRFVSGHTAEHVDGLIRGRLDAGLVMLPASENRLTFKVLHRERLILALPNQHPLTRKRHIEVTDLDQLPLVKIRSDIEPRFGNSLKRSALRSP